MNKGRRYISILFVAVIVLIGYLHYQVDDEVYYGIHELEYIAESADISEGTVIVPEDYEGVYAETPAMALRKGSYTMEIDHQGEVDSEVVVTSNQEAIETFVLPADELFTTFHFELDGDADYISIQFLTHGTGAFTFKHMDFRADSAFYTDSWFAVVLTLILFVFTGIYVRSKFYREGSDVQKVAVIATVALAIFISFPLYNNFLNSLHDLDFHMMRIEGIKDGLLHGQFPVNIYAGDIKNHGYLACLYPSLFLYIPAVLRIFGVSMVTAYKFLLFLINLGTMASAYYAVKEISKSQQAAVIGMFLYALAPYRLVNLYIRGALGESLAMVFIPIIIVGLYQLLIGNQKKWYVLVLGLTGLVQSHVLSCLMVGVLCVCFVLFYVKKLFVEKRILSMIKALALTLVMNLGFVIPFLYYLQSDLKTSELTVFGFFDMSSFPSQLFMLDATTGDSRVMGGGIVEELITGIGLVGVAGVVLTILYFVLNKESQKEDTRFMRILFVMELAYLYGTTSWCPWKTIQKIGLFDRILTMIQFPWRMLAVAAALGAILVAIAIWKTNVLREHKSVICLFLLILSLIGANTIMETYLEQEIEYIKLSSKLATSAPSEYAPKRADLDSLTWNDKPEYSDDTMTVSDYHKQSTTVRFSYEGNQESAVIAVPMLYYKGFKAQLETGEILPVSESEKGLVQFTLPASDSLQNVVVYYRQPWVFYVGYLASLLGILACAVVIVKENKKK